MTLDTLVLLPGLDGTGALFADLISELPPALSVNIARYPTQRFLSYSELVPCVQEVAPSTAGCGTGFGLDEAKHPSPKSTGNHIHLQIPLGPGGGHGDLPKNTCSGSGCK